MADLLNRFGPVVDLGGHRRRPGQVKISHPMSRTASTTYLDAGMVGLAQVAAALGLPFHPRGHRHCPHRQVAGQHPGVGHRREVSRSGLQVIRPGQSGVRAGRRRGRGWAGRLCSNRGRPRGSRYTFLAHDGGRAGAGCSRPPWARGDRRMVLEGYLADDPARAAGTSMPAYVSVESVVADGDISHLALTGRFPPAENFRETGFFIPAALDNQRSRRPCWPWPPGPRRPWRTHRVPAHRSEVHPRGTPDHRGQRTGGRRRARDAGAGRRHPPPRTDSSGGSG